MLTGLLLTQITDLVLNKDPLSLTSNINSNVKAYIRINSVNSNSITSTNIESRVNIVIARRLLFIALAQQSLNTVPLLSSTY